MIDVGVAKPKAQGQAIIKTLIVVTIAKDRLLKNISQTEKVIIPIPITIGTKTLITISAIFCIGALLL